MTACTNNGGKARRVVTAALVGALSVGAVPAIALATGTGDVSLLATDEEVWQGAEFTFDHEANEDGSYTVTKGDAISFVSAKDLYGAEYGVNDVTVIFFDRTQDKVTDETTATAVDAKDTIAQRAGSMPKGPETGDGEYWMIVFEGDTVRNDGTLFTPIDSSDLKTVISWNPNYKAFKLTVADKTTSLDGAQAFEWVNDPHADYGIADDTFNYTGGKLNVGFKVGDDILDADKYGVVWTSVPKGADEPKLASRQDYYTVTDAGTYTAKLTAKDGGDYTGSVDVTFEVQGIDLESAAVSVSPVDKNTGFNLNGTLTLPNDQITVNGVELDKNAELEATLIAMNDTEIPGDKYNTLKTPGKYTFRLTAKDGQGNVTGTCLVDAYVVDDTVDYSYFGVDGTLTGASATLGEFDPAMGKAFTPDAFSAKVAGEPVDFTCTVTKGGEVVTSYDEPGEYVVTLDTPVGETESGTSYAGHQVVKFTVAYPDYSYAKIFASFEGKNIAPGASFEYTGEAVTPTVVVRDSKTGEVYAEGEDYTWKLVDADDNEVESATEVGPYKIVVTYNGTAGEKELSFSIGKVTLTGVKAAADFFALPADGSAATPSFVGVTADGDEVALSADQISVRYYAEWNEDGDGNFLSVKPASRVDADDLTEAGTYYASVTVLTSASGIQTSGELFCPVKVSKAVSFADVDANAWYAGPVYKAAELKYMNGAGGTNLFLPGSSITRAELACVMFNMAGQQGGTSDTYPTKFEDVAADTWFSQAVAWASEHGVVNGSGTTFAPFATATREQVACVLYNFAKVKGEDVSVDADAALAELPDASSVSPWAREAVAWAVDNGVMGNGGVINPQGTITRAEVAAMAVNYQPEAIEKVD